MTACGDDVCFSLNTGLKFQAIGLTCSTSSEPALNLTQEAQHLVTVVDAFS